jgi:glycosyltransferase involved in cell wall biosynthesis
MIDPPSQSTPSLRIALAHDWLVARRGGELVLDEIISSLDSDKQTVSKLYTMFDANIPITPDIDQLDKSVSHLSKLPPALRRWLLFAYPAAVAQLSRRLAKDHANSPIDLLISTHSSAIKAIKPPVTLPRTNTPTNKPVPHICYCHTPARYLWSQTSAYTSNGFKGRLRSLGLKISAPILKKWDKKTCTRVTQFIANSTHTANQIKEHYNRDAVVIHPPVRTDFFTLPTNQQTDQQSGQQSGQQTDQQGAKRSNALLLVSALEPYKRVDLAIDAAIIANRPLNIVGSGSHESHLRKHAAKQTPKGSQNQINFLGSLTDHELLIQFQTAFAFLFPQIEDFGITAVEAQAAGCPVIARRAGGALDILIESPSDLSTGVFFDQPDPNQIAEAISKLPIQSHDTSIGDSMDERCRNNALRFSPEVFHSKLTELIEQVTDFD